MVPEFMMKQKKVFKALSVLRNVCLNKHKKEEMTRVTASSHLFRRYILDDGLRLCFVVHCRRWDAT